MNIFEFATRAKLRFPSNRGELVAEQLFDLPLQSKGGFDLDTIARAVNKELQAAGEDSFVSTKNNTQVELLTMKLDILKFVIADKQNAATAATAALQRNKERLALLEALENKKASDLAGLSVAEIEAKLAALA